MAGIDVIVGDHVPEAIADYARRERADLIAIATHGRGGFARVLHGSVTDGVTKSAMSSILVFHPDKAGRASDLSRESAEEAREKSASFA
jgi:nucleotide-binding universal stress UspA family protein